MPEIGEILQCKKGRGNQEDLYAISVMKRDTYIVSRGQTLDHTGSFFACSANDTAPVSGNARLNDTIEYIR